MNSLLDERQEKEEKGKKRDRLHKNYPRLFMVWLRGEKDPFLGRMEMRPQDPPRIPETYYEPSDYSEIRKKTYNLQENKRIRRHSILYQVSSVLISLLMIGVFLYAVSFLPPVGERTNPVHNEVSRRYIEQGLEETGAVNVVAGMILNYRAFDTFGESNVLFAATCCVMLILMITRDTERKEDLKKEVLEGREVEKNEEEGDLILVAVAKILCPAIFLFGSYIVINGHLSPGGGFSGGAVIGAGLILYQNAFGFRKMKRFFTAKTNKKISFFALTFYCLSKSYSFYTGANHLKNIIPLGRTGAILSSGLILPLNICVGAVVACTMYSFYALFRRGEF